VTDSDVLNSWADVGASQLIIDGKIKLKNDSKIARFTKTGVEFENGSTLDADAFILATGYVKMRSSLTRPELRCFDYRYGNAEVTFREIFGDEVGDKLKPLFGLDEEGEVRGLWRDTGVPRLYQMFGNFALCRFYSKHIALRGCS